MKLHLQHNIERQIDEYEPIMPWLIRWAAIAMSRFKKGLKDGRTPYQRQKGCKCELEVVPFGETVVYRKPEIANEHHEALEERWEKGVWLGHARHTPDIMIGTASGTVKAWVIWRLPDGQQWDGDRISQIAGSPNNWRLDATEERQLVEGEDRESPELNRQLRARVGMRTGEKRSIYLSKRDFERYGYSDWCPGCRDIASGKKRKDSAVAPHNVACWRRMDVAIQEADRDRWHIFLLRQRRGGRRRNKTLNGTSEQ